MRLTVAFGISSLAVWLLGPLVKTIGFTASLWILAGIAAIRSAIVLLLPDERQHAQAVTVEVAK
jgi:thiol:disulfide interchange protein